MAEMDKRKQVEIALDFPVQLADRMLDKVTIRRPTMKDMIKHGVDNDMDMEAAIALIADLCGLLPEDVELFDTCDFEKVQKQLLSFRGVA